jgi:hypothetical protein
LNYFKPEILNLLLTPVQTVAGKEYLRKCRPWGLLGGSGKPQTNVERGKLSKLASVAIANRKTQENRPHSSNTVGTTSMNSVSRLAALAAPAIPPGSDNPETPTVSTAISANRETLMESTASQSDKPLTSSIPEPHTVGQRSNLVSMPSCFAETLLTFFHLQNHFTNTLSRIFTDIYPQVTKERMQEKTPFTSPSPDDLVQIAQKGSVSASNKVEYKLGRPEIEVEQPPRPGERNSRDTNNSRGNITKAVKSLALKHEDFPVSEPQLSSRSFRSQRKSLSEIKQYLKTSSHALSMSFVIIGESPCQN